MGQIWLHHDNAPAHRSELVQDFVATNGIRVLPHPPYSPDLAPCDFWLFPKLKSDLAGVRYESRSALGSAIHQYRRGIPEEDFTACFREWIRRLRKCVEANEEYFEKLWRVGLLIRCSFIFTGMLQGLIDPPSYIHRSPSLKLAFSVNCYIWERLLYLAYYSSEMIENMAYMSRNIVAIIKVPQIYYYFTQTNTGMNESYFFNKKTLKNC